MSTESTPLTSAQIWRDMSAEQRLAAARVFWEDEDSVPQQVEAVQAIAGRLHFRPQSVLKLGADRQARHLASLPRISESVAGRILVVYHLAAQRPMLEAFLNQLGIAHENGLIKESGAGKPDAARLAGAADALRAAFPPADVRLYLRTLAAQDPETWDGLLPVISGWPAS